MLILRYILLFLLLISCEGSPEREIPFYTVDKLPIIEGTINNKKALFIVDTGASFSSLDLNQKLEYDFSISSSKEIVAGFNSTSILYKADGVVVKLDTLPLNIIFKASNLKYVVDAIKREEKLKVSGIIGTDVFKDQGFIIDYKTNSIRY